jgi:signal transduction histidine kinase
LYGSGYLKSTGLGAAMSVSREPSTATRAVDLGPPVSASLSSFVWAIRAAAYVLIVVETADNHGVFGWGRSKPADHVGLVAAALIVSGVLMAAWGGFELASRCGRPVPGWATAAVLTALGVASGLVTSVSIAETLIVFTAIAVLAAGSELPIGQACGVAASAILAVEVSSLAFGYNTGDVGWPLVVIAALLIGRNRRDSRLLTTQSLALVEQSERTLAEQTRAATLDERTRIARDIHDLLAHSLGALGIQLEAAEALLTDARDIDRALPILNQARRLAASGLEETRHAIEALRVDTPPLPTSLAGLAESHSAMHGTAVDLTIFGEVRPLDADTNLALYRIAQEALVNAAKHAPSASVLLRLDYQPDRTNVTVTTAPDATAIATAPMTATGGVSGGYGLAGMRERLLLIGGTLTAGPEGRGWTVQAEIPL